MMENGSGDNDWLCFCEEEAGLIALLLSDTGGLAWVVISPYNQGFMDVRYLMSDIQHNYPLCCVLTYLQGTFAFFAETLG